MSEQTKGFFVTNWFKLFIVAFAVALLLIYFERESALDSCMEQVGLDYSKAWDFQCNEAKLKENCSLPRLVAEGIEKSKNTRSELCIKRYSFK
jgi:hypothetical protein